MTVDGRTVAELLDEIRRAHTEIDRWRRCAVRWQALFLAAETRLGALEERQQTLFEEARRPFRRCVNVEIVGERL